MQYLGVCIPVILFLGFFWLRQILIYINVHIRIHICVCIHAYTDIQIYARHLWGGYD